MAVNIGADEFYILTDVPKVYVNFRKPDERALDTITVAEAEALIAEGQFSEGSMLPKVRADLYFVEHGGKECVITDAAELRRPGGGTRIVRSETIYINVTQGRQRAFPVELLPPERLLDSATHSLEVATLLLKVGRKGKAQVLFAGRDLL